MAEIIQFEDLKTEKLPHATGIVRCLECGNEWMAVYPIVDGFNTWLECSKCKLVKGRPKYNFEADDKPFWTCHCGNQLFAVHKEGIFCPGCGQWQYGYLED
jgi:hypothetical protein